MEGNMCPDNSFNLDSKKKSVERFDRKFDIMKENIG